MIHRDTAILRRPTDRYDLEGKPLMEPDRTIKCTISPTNKLVKKPFDQIEFIFVEANIEVQTKEELRLGDILIYNDRQYTIISREEFKPFNRRLNSEWVGYAE